MLTSRYGKLNQENIAKRYQNQPRFVKDMTNTCWCVFSVHRSNCRSLAKCVC